MNLEKINMQKLMEEIYNTCEVGVCFEDRAELEQLRYDVIHFVDLLNKYEKNKFETK